MYLHKIRNSRSIFQYRTFTNPENRLGDNISINEYHKKVYWEHISQFFTQICISQVIRYSRYSIIFKIFRHSVYIYIYTCTNAEWKSFNIKKSYIKAFSSRLNENTMFYKWVMCHSEVSLFFSFLTTYPVIQHIYSK